MSAVTQIPEFYTTEFGTNWEHLVQQKESRLKEYVTLTTVRGKEKTFNQTGVLSMQRVTLRAGDTRTSDTPLQKRWLRTFPYDLASLFDEWDETFLGDVVLPTSDAMTSHVSAYNRTCDDVIIEALGGAAYSGEDGTTRNDLPSTQSVSVSYGTANSGLTLGKLIRARHILGVNEVDESDPLIFVYTQQQLTDLLDNVNEVKSSDYNQVQALVDGTLDYYMGFKFVKLERLPKSGVARSCYAYAKSGLKFGSQGRKVHIDVRADKSHALQIRSVASLGAVRTEEKKVVQVICQEPA